MKNPWGRVDPIWDLLLAGGYMSFGGAIGTYLISIFYTEAMFEITPVDADYAASYIAYGVSVGAMVIFWIPALYKNPTWMGVASVFCVVGVWIEKGMGLIIPGLIPSPMGNLVEYRPSSAEFLISLGIWALGAMLFTVMAKVALAIQFGDLKEHVRTDRSAKHASLAVPASEMRERQNAPSLPS